MTEEKMTRPEFETTGNAPELISISGWLYIHHASRDYDKPEQTHTFYPLRVRSLHYNTPRKVTYHDVMGIYRDNWGVGYRCVDGGQTKPDTKLTYIEPSPCPGRYRKTRYQYGRWEKYTKAKGWEWIG